MIGGIKILIDFLLQEYQLPTFGATHYHACVIFRSCFPQRMIKLDVREDLLSYACGKTRRV